VCNGCGFPNFIHTKMKYTTGDPEYGSLGEFARAINSSDRTFSCSKIVGALGLAGKGMGKKRTAFIVCVSFMVLLWIGAGLLGGSPAPSLGSGEVVVIDAGSSGSRVYVYSYSLDLKAGDVEIGSSAALKISPGISSYAEHPTEAFKSIEPLLDFAYTRVSDKTATPIYLMATAGMRLVAPGPREQVFQAIRDGVKADGRFRLTSDEQIRMISGKEEGAFAWIALNYAVDELYSRGDPREYNLETGTCGLIEIGGSSAQVAWEVAPQDLLGVPEEYRFPVDVSLCVGASPSSSSSGQGASGAFELYVTTYLGFGANAAGLAYTEALIEKADSMASGATARPSTVHVPITDPCMMVGQTRTHEERVFVGTGDYDKCRLKLIPVLRTQKSCEKEPCSLDGRHQAAMREKMHLFGLSEVWYTMNDALHLTEQDYDEELFDASMHGWCAQVYSGAKTKHDGGFWPGADEDRFARQCFKAAYMSVFLHQGIGLVSDVDVDGPENNDIQIDTDFTAADSVDGVDVEWSMGAALQLLTADLRQKGTLPRC
jgi:Golgi nucleoside diphosphatase